MQNIDFYERQTTRSALPDMRTFDPEFFSRLAQATPRELERARKKASRLFFIILSLCIMSFTAGIIIGVKFSGGKREIVDPKTYHAMADMGKQLSDLVSDRGAERKKGEMVFPRDTYPYAIRIDKKYDKNSAHRIAGFLSQRGHTVILTNDNNVYRVYIGPYRSAADAEKAMKKISAYNKYSLAENCRLIKR